ncbi:hypothetical protein GYA44_02710, partial [Candidatus Microgenomates bacterium]|nr:hypothetical protein [Candidatus Microgenomates bacterium]
FTEGVEQAELSRKLAKIEQEVGIDIRLEESLLRDFEKKQVVEIFKDFGFKSLIPRLDEIDGNEEVSDSAQLDMFSTNTNKTFNWAPKESIDLEISKSKEIVVAYINKEESSTGEEFFCVRCINERSSDYVLKEVPDISKCPNVTSYNWEEMAVNFPDSSMQNLFDISLFAHMINSGKKSFLLGDLAFDYSSKALPEKLSPSVFTNILDAISEIKLSLVKKADDIELYDYTKSSIKEILKKDNEYLLNVLKEVEVPISQVLSKMEKRGIKIDIDYLSGLNDNVLKKVESLSKEIFDTVGHEFNINSPKQLSDILFNELGLQSNKKLSTRESVLNDLVGTHPCIEKILEYRELNKIYSTYTNPLLQMARENDEGAIHTDFKQTGTSSGRLSSVNPNMQNLPAQGEWAEKLRKAFVARDGFKFVGMDYSQIELRIMADMSKDDLLIEDFKNDLDIHRSTASRILDKDIEEITKAERSIGKTVNFGILFGQTSFGLASMLKIPNEVAQGYIRAYFDHYLGVENYIRTLEKEAYKFGYVQTMLGTTRIIRGIQSKNIRMRRAAQREAVNMPIQGSESDIMKLAMNELDSLIEKEFKDSAYILLQVHDELVFEVKEEKVEDFEKKASYIMKNIVSLEVPLDVHSSTGDNLSELK